MDKALAAKKLHFYSLRKINANLINRIGEEDKTLVIKVIRRLY
jgi:hypothetical protein